MDGVADPEENGSGGLLTYKLNGLIGWFHGGMGGGLVATDYSGGGGVAEPIPAPGTGGRVWNAVVKKTGDYGRNNFVDTSTKSCQATEPFMWAFKKEFVRGMVELM